MTAVPVTRCSDIRLLPDPTRVIARSFVPGDHVHPDGSTRIDVVLRRILAMSDAEVTITLGETVADFAHRHRDFEALIERHFAVVADRIGDVTALSSERRRLIGAYFTHEYSVEAAALGNPSMVEAPDQSGIADGATRFIMSLRAVGEGHISSIAFRSGVLGPDMSITLDDPAEFAVTGEQAPTVYHKDFFEVKLRDLGALGAQSDQVLRRLGSEFSLDELENAMTTLDGDVDSSAVHVTKRLMHWIATSNYTTYFTSSTELTERVIFPTGPTESKGMEDARLVRFVHDDGRIVYYATYTAFNGTQILPQLIETDDFMSFRITTLSGECAQNKGIALFPRQLDGQFAALGRHDNVNNFLMRSHDIRVWRDSEKLQEPDRPWELMQLGNCGSPLETEAGWLVITHGVGPFRRYCLGAVLLDIDDPCRVLGHLREPLLMPTGDEREGYVPNVVYSCGSLIHADHLVVPYGFADTGASIATVRLDDLLTALIR
jgi:predicted GH43/DUF377 family glycosyl hydrolase